MKTSKTTVIGLLICLTAIFFTNEIWLGMEIIEILPIVGVYGFPVGVVVTLIGLLSDEKDMDYETEDHIDDGTHISQVTCPECGKNHDIDYPKCPYCKHHY